MENKVQLEENKWIHCFVELKKSQSYTGLQDLLTLRHGEVIIFLGQIFLITLKLGSSYRFETIY